MRIPLSAPDIQEADIAAVLNVLRQSRLSMGPRQEEFERAVAEYVGVPFGIAVNSGTSGLHLAIRALGIAPGDEVILPSFSFIAPANAICYEQATPVFVEIEPEMLTLDPACVERAITPRTRAILAVHTFGCPADLDALSSLARRHNLLLIEDACEALGAEYDQRRVGGFGDVGVFAFYPNKQITTGEGGMIITHDAALAERMRSLRNQGRSGSDDWFQHAELGYSYRLPEMNCALGAEQMKRIDAVLARREEIARVYESELRQNSDLRLLPIDQPGRRFSWFTYPIRLAERFTRQDRDRIVVEMGRAGIECGRYFAPIHLQPAYRAVHNINNAPPRLFPLTETYADRSIALPLFHQITEQQIEEVCRYLSEFLRRPVARAATS